MGMRQCINVSQQKIAQQQVCSRSLVGVHLRSIAVLQCAHHLLVLERLLHHLRISTLALLNYGEILQNIHVMKAVL